MIKSKYIRNSLNPGQVKILDLVYKYRFVSRQSLAVSLGVKPGNGLYEKLEILVKHEYLGKRMEKRSIIENVPAGYYLTPKALKYLRSLPNHEHIDDQAFQESYRDKSTTGSAFVRHQLNVYREMLALQRQHPALKVFTRRDMRRYSYFPKKLPDAFLSLPSEDPQQPHRFFLDIVRDRQPRSELVNRLKVYTEFFDDGGWDETGSPVPVILLLCEWGPAEKSIQRLARRQLGKLDSDLRVFTTTFVHGKDKVAWTSVYDVDEILSLDAITVNP